MSTITVKESYMDTLRLFGEVDELLDEAVEQYLIDRIVQRIKRARAQVQAFEKLYGTDYATFAERAQLDEDYYNSIKVIHCGNRICWPGSTGMRRHESGQRSSTT